jgi:hypothetical protein
VSHPHPRQKFGVLILVNPFLGKKSLMVPLDLQARAQLI